jgi:hypothetical protein
MFAVFEFPAFYISVSLNRAHAKYGSCWVALAKAGQANQPDNMSSN